MRYPESKWIEWLYRQPQATSRLFCFHHAGGSSRNFRLWRDDHISTVDWCAVELPGRGKRVMEPAYTHIAPLIEDLAVGLWPALCAKPFIFFGHSMGALVAYELTRLLRRAYAVQPQLLVISGHRAPHIPPWTQLHTLNDQDLWMELLRLNGTPKEVTETPELMEFMTPIVRADFTVCETYTHSVEKPLDCPIVVYGGEQDPSVALEDLQGWLLHTTATCHLKLFPGDHFYLYARQREVLGHLAMHLQTLTYSLP